MPERDFEIAIGRCPLCGAADSCTFKGKIHDIPYFGETMESILFCRSCNFRHADVMHLGEKEPARYEYRIASQDDMMVRVVRSSTCHIEIPELGVHVRPGPAGEGFISNIEGVLERVKNALLIIKNSGCGNCEGAEKKLRDIEDLKEGKTTATLILDDPSGNSAIISPKVVKKKLTENCRFSGALSSQGSVELSSQP
ncbi:MAG: ZPR1 zinc finger domain-containing protein [Candidatus Hadarchaeales archaeon]